MPTLHEKVERRRPAAPEQALHPRRDPRQHTADVLVRRRPQGPERECPLGALEEDTVEEQRSRRISTGTMTISPLGGRDTRVSRTRSLKMRQGRERLLPPLPSVGADRARPASRRGLARAGVRRRRHRGAGARPRDLTVQENR